MRRNLALILIVAAVFMAGVALLHSTPQTYTVVTFTADNVFCGLTGKNASGVSGCKLSSGIVAFGGAGSDFTGPLDGDTVILPAGSIDVPSTLVIKKGITIQGATTVEGTLKTFTDGIVTAGLNIIQSATANFTTGDIGHTVDFIGTKRSAELGFVDFAAGSVDFSKAQGTVITGIETATCPVGKTCAILSSTVDFSNTQYAALTSRSGMMFTVGYKTTDLTILRDDFCPTGYGCAKAASNDLMDITLTASQYLYITGLTFEFGSHQINGLYGTGAGYKINHTSGYTTGDTAIAVDTGSGTILAGSFVTFGADTHQYQTASNLSGGVVTLAAPGLLQSFADNTTVNLVHPSLAGTVINVDGVVSPSHMRIHHNHFISPPAARYLIFLTGETYPVIDHNQGDSLFGNESFWMSNGVKTIAPGQTVASSFGDGSWASPMSWGTEKAAFFEDNIFRSGTKGDGHLTVDGWEGGRVVYRHNVGYNAGISNHGGESATKYSRPMLQSEIYDDVRYVDFVKQNTGQCRGGTAKLFRLRFDQPPASGGWESTTYRMHSFTSKFGPSDGSSPIDINDPTVYFSCATCVTTGGTNTFKVASSGWTSGQWLNFTFRNSRTGIASFAQQFTVDGSGTATITLKAQTLPPQDVYQVGDGFTIRKVLVSAEGGSRGAPGDLFAGSSLATDPRRNTTTNTLSWGHERLDPIYQWLNTNLGADIPNFAFSAYPNLLNNRDFYNYVGNIQTSPTSPFDGLHGGIGVGTLANRPTHCTAGTDVADGSYKPGVGYWATDSGPDGTLYICKDTDDNWSTVGDGTTYRPFQYPHPMVQSASVISLTGDLVFGPINVASPSTRTLHVTNAGELSFDYTSISDGVSDGVYTFTGSTSGTIAPHATVDIGVLFSPTASISYNRTITVVNNANAGTGSISVTGSGTTPGNKIVDLSPTSPIGFGPVPQFSTINGQFPTTTFAILSKGSDALHVSNVQAPSWVSLNWTSGDIAPSNGSQTVTVTFPTTIAPGTYSANIIVESNATSTLHDTLAIQATVTSSGAKIYFLPHVP